MSCRLPLPPAPRLGLRKAQWSQRLRLGSAPAPLAAGRNPQLSHPARLCRAGLLATPQLHTAGTRVFACARAHLPHCGHRHMGLSPGCPSQGRESCKAQPRQSSCRVRTRAQSCPGWGHRGQAPQPVGEGAPGRQAGPCHTGEGTESSTSEASWAQLGRGGHLSVLCPADTQSSPRTGPCCRARAPCSPDGRFKSEASW